MPTITSPNRLGSELRRWRDARRVRQLELAVRAGTTQRHLSFVETGRSLPGRTLVLRLAESLDLALRERNALLAAAGFAALYPELPLDSPALRHVNAALTTMIRHHEPFPAVVMDRGWNVIRANAGARRLFGGLSHPEPMPEPANVLRLMIGPGRVRDSVLNWEPVVATLLARVRREAVGGVLDAETVALLDDLVTLPEVAAIERGGESPATPVLDVLFRFRGHRLAFFSLLTTVGTAIDLTSQELRVEEFFPLDDATHALWESFPTGEGFPAGHDHAEGT